MGGSSSRRSTIRGGGDPGGGGERDERLGDVALGARVVVAEGLAVGGRRDEPVTALEHLVDGGDDLGPRRSGEGERVGEAPVVDDEVHGARRVAGVPPAQRTAGVEGLRVALAVPIGAEALVGAVAVRLPRLLGRVERARAGDLAGGEDREADALLGEDGEHGAAHGRLRQPHALGVAAEAVAEVGDAPPDLGAQVPLVAQREDGVPVGLGDGPTGPAVGVEDPLVHVGAVGLEPRQQRGAQVEREVLEQVHLGAVGPGQRGDRVVALGGDPLVPVVEGRRPRLLGDHAGPGVLPRRLVEVTVEDEAAVAGGHQPADPGSPGAR